MNNVTDQPGTPVKRRFGVGQKVVIRTQVDSIDDAGWPFLRYLTGNWNPDVLLRPDPVPMLRILLQEPLRAETWDGFVDPKCNGIPPETIQGWVCRYCDGRSRADGGNAITLRKEDFRHADDCVVTLATAGYPELLEEQT